MSSEPSIFERIMAGDIPSEMVHEDDHAIVIQDINPQAPIHLLIIPGLKSLDWQMQNCSTKRY